MVQGYFPDISSDHSCLSSHFNRLSVHSRCSATFAGKLAVGITFSAVIGILTPTPLNMGRIDVELTQEDRNAGYSYNADGTLERYGRPVDTSELPSQRNTSETVTSFDRIPESQEALDAERAKISDPKEKQIYTEKILTKIAEENGWTLDRQKTK